MGRSLMKALPLILLSLAFFGLTCGLSTVFSSQNTPIYTLRSTASLHEHVDYLPASMSVRYVRLSHGYCCDLFCFRAQADNATVEQCGALRDRVEALSPSRCASAESISPSLLCPPSGPASRCNDGASFCTSSCDETCTEKLTVCTCPCQHCSTCSCCKRVEHLCRLGCTPCDKVWMMLDFEDWHGNPYSVNFSQNFSLNSAEAQSFYNTYKGVSAIVGFYKSFDPTIVHVDSDPTIFDVAHRTRADTNFFGGPEDNKVSYGAKLGEFKAFPIFTLSVVVTGLLVALLFQRMRRGSDRQHPRIASRVIGGLCMGIIWPSILVLLILQIRYCTPNEEFILVPQLIAIIGCLPLLILWLYHTM